eukprot:10478294-Lingulodinium_polyedra.AAC.1
MHKLANALPVPSSHGIDRAVSLSRQATGGFEGEECICVVIGARAMLAALAGGFASPSFDL